MSAATVATPILISVQVLAISRFWSAIAASLVRSCVVGTSENELSRAFKLTIPLIGEKIDTAPHPWSGRELVAGMIGKALGVNRGCDSEI